ncbi:hypothetical protein Hdeb2414_s0016g00471251 [Helianthus debilis subsp. tardiflorus]
MNFTGSKSTEPIWGIIPPNSGRILGEPRPKMRRLHDVYKGLGDSVSSDEESEFSDTMTLNTVVRKIKAKRRKARILKGKMKEPVMSDFSSESDNDSDEHVPPAAGSGVPRDIEYKYEISVRTINRNPSEFQIKVSERFVLKS